LSLKGTFWHKAFHVLRQIPERQDYKSVKDLLIYSL
jgi:hypothetical protein